MRGPLHRRDLLRAAAALLGGGIGAHAGWISATPQENSEALRAAWKAEADPVRKSKLLTRMGEAQLGRLRQQAAAGRYEEALKAIEEYRDDVKATHSALRASGRDAERKPAGFKQLQIHLRKGIRVLNDTILQLPVDMRQFFEPVRRDLDEIDKDLIEALFPRRPEKKKEPTKPGS